MKHFVRAQALLLAAVLAACGMVGCGRQPAVSDPGGVSDSSRYIEDSGSEPGSEPSSAESSDTQTSGTTSGNDSGVTTSPTTKNDGQNSSAGTTTKRPDTVVGDGKLEVSYTWHPGLPGYDASYTLEATYNGAAANGEVTLSCATGGVQLSGTTVTVPESVRSAGKELAVTVTHKKSGSACTVKIPCKVWKQTFADEFNGTELDRTVWNEHNTPYTSTPPADADTYEVVDRGGLAKNCYSVSNGVLNMYVKNEPVYDTANKKKYLYSECCLDSKNGFMQKYGCFITRMQVAPFAGCNSAFWLLPNGSYGTQYMNFLQDDPVSGLAEIDIIEASVAFKNSSRRHYCITEHFYNYTKNNQHKQRATYHEVSGSLTDWHTYGCVWAEDAVYYYCDGKLTRASTDLQSTSPGGRSVQRAYMLLDIALYLDGSWVGKRDFTAADLPIAAKVDWVRAYK